MWFSKNINLSICFFINVIVMFMYICRFYDCRATVTKKMQRLRLGQNRGKPIKLREWEAELRDVLLAEDVPGFSSRGQNHRAGGEEN